ncbi:MAG: hypothetical protein ABII08_01255 [Candidatus Beckwithbacteria bacterium]
MAKSAQRIEARKLRRKGFSINEVAERVTSSKRTVSRWCSDIELNNKQKEILWSRAKTRYSNNFRKYCERKRLKTKQKIKNLNKKGINKGVSLYWAEGFKKDSRIGFANTDSEMIRFFIKWLVDCLKVDRNDLSFCVTVNIDHKNRINEIEKYWRKELGIDKSQFTKPFYQKTKWKKKFENPEKYHGVLRVRVVKSLDRLRVIHGYIEGLKKNCC